MSYDDHIFQNEQGDEPVPGAFAWFFQQIGWYLRKLVLWPIADTFRWIGRGIAGFFDAFRYRSPLAYIGATLAVTVTAGAVAAAVYFYRQSETPAGPVTTPSTIAREAAVATPVQAAVPAPVPAAVPAQNPDTLAGVVPNFRTSAARRKATGKKAGAKTLVKPQPAPKSGPLKVAHKFATAFVGYEVGDKQANRGIRQTASAKLSRELRTNPPKLPASGSVPMATVMNVVKGKAGKDRLVVSVALQRAGAASELRLALTRNAKTGWVVSEVRG